MQKILIGCLQLYRMLLSPYLRQSCRFTPSCSAYALEALRVYGTMRGSILSVRRLLRCHPWCAGGYDPVPQREECTRG